MNTIVTLPIDDNQGYSADQVETNVTLQDMLEALQEAIEEHGEDAVVVLSNGQRYGAGFGAIRPAFTGREWFQAADEDDSDF